MKIITSLLLIGFITACTSILEDSGNHADEIVVSYCNEMVGQDWVRSDPPVLQKKLLSMARFHAKPKGIIWYISPSDDYMACAFTSDPDGCGYGTHEFRKLDGRWFYSPGSLQEKICVVG